MLELQQLSYCLPGVTNAQLLDNLNVTINKGESVAITGRSGSGKTTLLALMAGLSDGATGNIIIDGHNICAMNEDQRADFRAQSIGFVFQSFHLLESLSALANVMLPLQLANAKDAKAEATAFLQKVGLGERLHHKPSELSGGEQQRVAIARAFAGKPDYLLADEPTGNLDEQTGETIIDLLFQLNREQGTTLVLVTHEQRLADRCQRVLHLQNGKLYE